MMTKMATPVYQASVCTLNGSECALQQKKSQCTYPLLRGLSVEEICPMDFLELCRYQQLKYTQLVFMRSLLYLITLRYLPAFDFLTVSTDATDVTFTHTHDNGSVPVALFLHFLIKPSTQTNFTRMHRDHWTLVGIP